MRMLNSVPISRHNLLILEKAHQMGQDVTKIPYDDRSWGTTFKARANATMSRNFGLDMKQLNLQGRISNNHSGDVSFTVGVISL